MAISPLIMVEFENFEMEHNQENICPPSYIFICLRREDGHYLEH